MGARSARHPLIKRTVLATEEVAMRVMEKTFDVVVTMKSEAEDGDKTVTMKYQRTFRVEAPTPEDAKSKALFLFSGLLTASATEVA